MCFGHYYLYSPASCPAGKKCTKKCTLASVEDQVRAGKVCYCHCGEVLKPAVTFFGEALPKALFTTIGKDLPRCDLLLVIGTSLKVGGSVHEVLRGLPPHVPQVLINRVPVTLPPSLSEGFDVTLLGQCDDIASYLCDRLDWGPLDIVSVRTKEEAQVGVVVETPAVPASEQSVPASPLVPSQQAEGSDPAQKEYLISLEPDVSEASNDFTNKVVMHLMGSKISTSGGTNTKADKPQSGQSGQHNECMLGTAEEAGTVGATSATGRGGAVGNVAVAETGIADGFSANMRKKRKRSADDAGQAQAQAREKGTWWSVVWCCIYDLHHIDMLFIHLITFSFYTQPSLFFVSSAHCTLAAMALLAQHRPRKGEGMDHITNNSLSAISASGALDYDCIVNSVGSEDTCAYVQICSIV